MQKFDNLKICENNIIGLLIHSRDFYYYMFTICTWR